MGPTKCLNRRQVISGRVSWGKAEHLTIQNWVSKRTYPTKSALFFHYLLPVQTWPASAIFLNWREFTRRFPTSICPTLFTRRIVQKSSKTSTKKSEIFLSSYWNIDEKNLLALSCICPTAATCRTRVNHCCLCQKKGWILAAHATDLTITEPVTRAAYLRAAIRRPQTAHSLQRPVRIRFGLSLA